MGNPHGLRPEKRQNVNGHVVTRWVKNAFTPKGGDRLPAAAAPATPAPSRGIGQIVASASDPDRLWGNFEALTEALRGPNGPEALKEAEEGHVAGKLKDAWLSKHGLAADSPLKKDVQGPEGYDAYSQALGEMSAAAEVASVRSLGATAQDPEKLWENFDAALEVVKRARNTDEVLRTMEEERVPLKLKEAWLGMHGVSEADRRAYTSIGGENGYERYREALDRLSSAAKSATSVHP